ncbi:MULTISPECIES: helix-turn-helix transcriptional regulator [unclassified Microbacterium]|uniref:helix-turn-helix transcriptional regulator n=1 Tax=unclassified Microbacterium TaxID=2609290 RepID=UPI00301A2320
MNGSVAGILLALRLIVTGKAEEALALLAEAVEPNAPFRAYASVVKGLALILSGHQYEAAAWATDQLQKSVTTVDRVSFAGHAYVAGLALIAHGRHDEANEILGIPLRAGMSTRGTPLPVDGASITMMSLLARHGGRVTSADALEHVAASHVNSSLALPYSDPAWSKAMSLFVAGDTQGARDVIELIAARADDRGDIAAADHAIYVGLCVHYDDHDAEARRSRIQRVGGALALAQIDARAALTRQDPGALLAAAMRLTEIHAPQSATKHYLTASHLFRDRGDSENAAIARASLRVGSDMRALYGDTQSRKTLTSRESQVARYIAEGLSNGEIASRLMLSIRTVESHINRIARKTGSANRAEISRLSQTQIRS